MVEDKEPSAEVTQPSPEVSTEAKPVEEPTETKPTEEPKAEVAKPKQEKKETPEDKYRKLQSESDKKIADLNKQLEDSKKQFENFQRQQTLAALQQQHVRDIQQYGDTPQLRTLHEREMRTIQFAQWLEENSPKLDKLAQIGKASLLSDQYGVDSKELLKGNYTTPQEMEIAAIKLAAEKKVEEVRPTTNFPTPTQSGAGQMSDEDFIKSYGRGESDDHSRFWKLTHKKKR